MRAVSLFVVMIVISACAQRAPEFHLSLSETEIEKLLYLAPIELKRAPFFTVGCYENITGMKSYYVTSSGTSIKSKTANWSCVHFSDCPDLTIDVADGLAFVRDIDAKVTEFSKTQVSICAQMALGAATDKSRTTPGFAEQDQESINEKSWAAE